MNKKTYFRPQCTAIVLPKVMLLAGSPNPVVDPTTPTTDPPLKARENDMLDDDY